MGSCIMEVVSFKQVLVQEQDWTMLFWLLDGTLKVDKTLQLSRIHGELDGENLDISECKSVVQTLELVEFY